MKTSIRTTAGRTSRTFALTAALLICACMDTSDVKNFNNESADALIQTPTPSSIATSVQGLMVQARASIVGEPTGYLHSLSQKGRETYTMDAATPGLIPLDFVGPLGPESDNFWAGGYRGIKLGQVILKALASVTGMSDAQKEGVRGFTKTMQAYEFWKIIANHDQSGAVIDVDATFATEAKPIVSRDAVYAYISQLLDEGKTNLQAAGSTFMFKLSPGFAGFDTPANFLKVNRALKARIEVYRGSFAGMPAGAANYNAALTALTESFISTASTTAAALAVGAYHTYTTNSGDLTNTMFDPTGRVFHAHPSFETDAQLRADGTRDLRYVNKTFKKALRSQSGVTSDLGVRVYGSNTTGVPIIKNEELILLRAEANLALGNQALALADINFTKVNSGGLAAIADPGPAGLMDELVYERRYSLFFEGHRWYDMRRWGRLAQLPRDLPNGRIFSRIPVPLSECNGRSPAPTGCAPDPGI